MTSTVGNRDEPIEREAALTAELAARIAFVYGPLWRARNAAAFVSEFFTPDAIITASLLRTTWHGEQQIVPIIEETMDELEEMNATVVWTRLIGADAAAQFVNFKVKARDPAKHGDDGQEGKALYAWARTPVGWRVVADHSAYIGMDAAT